MKNIVILGQGGFAREVEFLISEINKENAEWNFCGFVGPDKTDLNYFGTDNDLENFKEEMNVAIGTGSSSINSRLIQKFQTNGNLIFPNLIHPSVVKADSVTFQQGNIVCANNTFTVDIKVGSFNVINLNCTCGHDTHIGDFNVLNPGVNCSGDVNIGNENLIGTNATVLQNLSIGNSNKIGAGAVITKSFDNELTLVGIPAKNIG